MAFFGASGVPFWEFSSKMVKKKICDDLFNYQLKSPGITGVYFLIVSKSDGSVNE